MSQKTTAVALIITLFILPQGCSVLKFVPVVTNVVQGIENRKNDERQEQAEKVNRVLGVEKAGGGWFRAENAKILKAVIDGKISLHDYIDYNKHKIIYKDYRGNIIYDNQKITYEDNMGNATTFIEKQTQPLINLIKENKEGTISLREIIKTIKTKKLSPEYDAELAAELSLAMLNWVAEDLIRYNAWLIETVKNLRRIEAANAKKDISVLSGVDISKIKTEITNEYNTYCNLSRGREEHNWVKFLDEFEFRTLRKPYEYTDKLTKEKVILSKKDLQQGALNYFLNEFFKIEEDLYPHEKFMLTYCLKKNLQGIEEVAYEMVRQYIEELKKLIESDPRKVQVVPREKSPSIMLLEALGKYKDSESLLQEIEQIRATALTKQKEAEQKAKEEQIAAGKKRIEELETNGCSTKETHLKDLGRAISWVKMALEDDFIFVEQKIGSFPKRTTESYALKTKLASSVLCVLISMEQTDLVIKDTANNVQIGSYSPYSDALETGLSGYNIVAKEFGFGKGEDYAVEVSGVCCYAVLVLVKR